MDIVIDCDFPGGNILVDRIDGDNIQLHQDLRDTDCDWFYWCFRVRNAEGRTLRFQFTQSRALGVHGPGVSLDEGLTWSWLGAAAVHDNEFVFSFPPDADDVRFSFAMPYQNEHWVRFIEGLDAAETISRHTLCTTKKGRDVEYILLGCLNAEPRHRVAIACRHHCCEMMVNYSLEGLIRWIAEDSDSEAQWLRENVQLFIVPFADKDGVEDGDQGKRRQPRDHGRDYEGESIFAATNAIRELLPGWGGDRLSVGIDLHCPWISGGNSEVIYLVGSRHHRIAEEQQRFSEILESVGSGPLPFLAENFLPFGKEWNVKESYTAGKGFSFWMAERPGVALGTTIEIPYANAGGAEVNQESARCFGKDLGMALVSYLRTLPS